MASQNSSPSRSYGFIGLGVMGCGMAKNLRAKIPESSTLYVCEVVAERRDQWVAETPGDIQVVTSPREISEKSDIIITMLPRGEHVREVFTNPITGLLSLDSSQEKEGKIFIDCSTIDVETSRSIGEAVQQSGLGVFTDAPVSGGVGGANAGTLTFMVGSSPDIFEPVKSVIANMGKAESIFHCGGPGAGLATKLINNYLSAINMIGVCEGMNLGRLYGLDPAVLAGVINVSTGMSRNSREQNPVKGISPTASSANDFKGGFTTELCRGVLEMSIELSEQLNAKSILAPTVQDLFSRAVKSEKCKGQDFRSIYRLFSEDDGSELTK
ncbi:NAD binding domain of 6-phosphogluconate dehydrogenase-domain-containing protein [Dactylonectria estremocensis]|uniref:3-hydroxyisobutyrate dehydrogenase n=1 Tax=Dactylonectria estremocensis TaxID=1079267 RepID=A0A9P9ETM9_9HYPO|nr:NAD binding domain of 6-phosphogluconate dehydrogenase-domain-containing protein [Dactylonectria estremocensis]